MVIPQKEILVRLKQPQYIYGEMFDKGMTVYLSLEAANSFISAGVGELVVNRNGYNTESDDYGTVTKPLDELLLKIK